MDVSTSAIQKAWGWTGLRPKQVLEVNSFGNLLIVDHTDRYWRICPEELSCVVVADTAADFAALRDNAEFLSDWEMARLREIAANERGQLKDGRVYCLKVPAVLGGHYEASNIADISLSELIAFSGDLGLQIKDLPDGTSVRLGVTE
jgi:hypothetical protein